MAEPDPIRTPATSTASWRALVTAERKRKEPEKPPKPPPKKSGKNK